MGIERLLLILEKIGNTQPENNAEIMIIFSDEKHIGFAKKVCDIVRNKLGKSCLMDLNRRSMKAQLREANKSGVRFALIIGDEEAANESLTIKYMQENKEQILIKIDELGDRIG